THCPRLTFRFLDLDFSIIVGHHPFYFFSFSIPSSPHAGQPTFSVRKARSGVVNDYGGSDHCGSRSDVSLLPEAISSEVSIEVPDSEMDESATRLSAEQRCLDDPGCVA
ncbi:hypothetical protein Dimus_029173, partial [Dionaea muscipula]